MSRIVTVGNPWWLVATITCCWCETRFRLDRHDSVDGVGRFGDYVMYEVECPCCHGHCTIGKDSREVELDPADGWTKDLAWFLVHAPNEVIRSFANTDAPGIATRLIATRLAEWKMRPLWRKSWDWLHGRTGFPG